MNDKTISNESEDKLHVLREFEFYGGCIRVKISVKNTSGLATLDAALELDIDDKVLYYDKCEPAYTEKNGKIILGNINPNTDRVIAIYLDPLICAKEGTDINCHVNFKYADGTPDTVHMKTLKIKGVCPIFWTENDINIGRLKELIKELHSQDNKVYILPKRVDMTDSLNICNNVIQRHDVRHIKTFKTTDAKIYECWYYGKTKVTKKDIVIKCAVRGDTESVEIFASGNDSENITWLLAEIGRNLTNEFEKLGKVQPVFNIHVKNSMLRGSNLLSFCDIDGACGGNVVIEDSFVGDTNVASRIREDKEKIPIEEQKKLDDVPKQEKPRKADLLRKTQDVQRDKDRQVRQKKEADRIQQKNDDGNIESGKKSSGRKWFFGVIIILVIVLGWYGTQYLNGIWTTENPADTQEHQLRVRPPTPTPTVIRNTVSGTGSGWCTPGATIAIKDNGDFAVAGITTYTAKDGSVHYGVCRAVKYSPPVIYTAYFNEGYVNGDNDRFIVVETKVPPTPTPIRIVTPLTPTPTSTPTPVQTPNMQSPAHKNHVGQGTANLNCDTCHGFPPKIPPSLQVCDNCHFEPTPTPTVIAVPTSIVFEKWLKSPNEQSWGYNVELWVVNSDGSGLRQLTQGFYDTGPEWSPNGLSITFSRSGTNTEGIFIIDNSGNNVRILSSNIRAYYPQWLRDDLIIFTTPRGPESEFKNSWQLYTISLKDQVEQIFNVGLSGTFSPKVSPNRRFIAFTSNSDGFIYVSNNYGENVRQLQSSQGAFNGYPIIWYPDNDHVLVQSSSGNCFKMGISDQIMEPVVGIDECLMSWSSDSNTIAYDFNNAIWLMDANGQNKRMLIGPNDDSHYRNPIWQITDNSPTPS